MLGTFRDVQKAVLDPTKLGKLWGPPAGPLTSAGFHAILAVIWSDQQTRLGAPRPLIYEASYLRRTTLPTRLRQKITRLSPGRDRSTAELRCGSQECIGGIDYARHNRHRARLG
jgi:hypothetical protein